MENKTIMWVLAVLILLNMFQTVQIQNISSDLKIHANKLENLRYDFENLENTIEEPLHSIEEGPSIVEKSSIRVIGISKENNEVNIALSWTLKELKKGEKVYIQVGTENLGEISFKNIPVSPIAGLYYEKKITLPLNGDYLFWIVTENNESIKTNYLDKISTHEKIVETTSLTE
ncbi:hypothetical protein [Methanococcus maripaludis]|nr:hypothetical protein [Methanococcus maripaludis]